MGCGCADKNKLTENNNAIMNSIPNVANNITNMVTNMTNEITLEQYRSMNMSIDQIAVSGYRLQENSPQNYSLKSLSLDVQNNIQSLETGASFQFSNTAIIVFGVVILAAALIIMSSGKKKQ